MTQTEFSRHDRIALARLSPEELKAQPDARDLLWDLVLTYWEQGKANGWVPALRQDWEAVAGMVDLCEALRANADAAEE